MTAPVTVPDGSPREIPEQRREDRGLPYLGRIFDYARDPVALMTQPVGDLRPGGAVPGDEQPRR